MDIDLDSGELSGSAPRTHLTGMLLKLMRHLAARPGRTAAREELPAGGLPLLGREEPLAELQASQDRLVVITGPLG